ncbi:MAG TPA: carboxypeptidase-like regulatory domain-containing protein [Longimicrobium sp.]|nr:carboxypeptidase-like regulatory domain-containing protein [Longimicrobium sp.]
MVGSIVGTVIDEASKKPLAGVLIVATSPALQGEQVVQTNASGQYDVPALPPGEYKLQFTLDHYRNDTQKGVKVPNDHSVTVNISLLPEPI